jgi:hypothetical protein
VITGAVLLALAASWALLVTRSTLWTEQPQRWAAVSGPSDPDGRRARDYGARRNGSTFRHGELVGRRATRCGGTPGGSGAD